MDSEDFLRDAEEFTRALHGEYYASMAGLKPGLDTSPIYRRYLPLFEIDRLEDAKHWDLEPLAVRYLTEFICSGFLHFRTMDLTERISAAEAAAVVEWDERPLPYRATPITLANEPNAVRRHDLERRQLEVMASFNPLREEREQRLQRDARGYGDQDYGALYSRIGAIDLAALAQQLQGFIDETNDLYFSALQSYLGELHILQDDATRCDLARVFRAADLDDLFPRDRALAVLHATIRDLGMVLEDQRNIRLDTDERPLKSSRAFCSTVRVPDDVRLVIRPSGGVQDYHALLHEAGHAEHYANVDRSLSFPFRCLGEAAITESYAFLLEYLMNNPYWLARHLGCVQPASFLRLAGFHKLYFLRRYGTKLIYELELHGADQPGDVAPLYDELLSKNLGVVHGPEAYLSDVDDGFYAAQYLRAWIFEAQHREFLTKEFDDQWFRNPKAGKYLVELWRDGQRHSLDEFVRWIGFPALDIGPVKAEILNLMGAN